MLFIVNHKNVYDWFSHNYLFVNAGKDGPRSDLAV